MVAVKASATGSPIRALAALATAALCVMSAQAASAAPVKNMVLVHGAFVDGSGWRPVYDILTRDGYAVSIVQEPLTSLADDVAATRRVLDRLDGPAILVGHSYGGAIITEAGNDPHVASRVRDQPAVRQELDRARAGAKSKSS